jgi:hypothetical protein
VKPPRLGDWSAGRYPDFASYTLAFALQLRKITGVRFVGLFIREKNWFEISLRQSEGEGKGRVRVENQAMYGKHPKWRPLVFM